MKKIFTMLACFLLAVSSIVLVGCGNKVVEIKTVYPESFKVVTVDVDGTTQNTYTLIKGKYNNRAVIYLEDEIVINGGAPTTIKYLWIANDNSTTANQLLEDIISRVTPKTWTNHTGDGYTDPDELELSLYLWDVKATGSYNDRYLVSSSETELVYRMNSDTIYISNDNYHLTNKRTQQTRNWTNTYTFADCTTEIPNIADIFAAL